MTTFYSPLLGEDAPAVSATRAAVPAPPLVPEQHAVLVQAGSLLRGHKVREIGSRNPKPVLIHSDATNCKAEPNCVHVQTSRGDWCIARTQDLIVAN